MSEQYGGPWNSPADGGGQPYPQSAPAAQPAGQPAYPGHPYPSYPTTASPVRTDYAPWGRRVLAYLIDNVPSLIGLIIFYVGYGQMMVAAFRSGNGTPEFGPGAPAMIVGGILMLVGTAWGIYNRWFVAGRTGQSMGKRVMKIVLIGDDTNAPIGPLNALLRDLLHTLDNFAYIGYLWPLWDERKQTFSDKIIKTVVITAPEQPA